jgi:hypothetical protein
MSHLTVDCKVTSNDDPFGEYANAFRILGDGSDVLLDFCVYSAQNGTAKLISRIRINLELAAAIKDRLEESFNPVTSPTGGGTIYIMPEIGGSQ